MAQMTVNPSQLLTNLGTLAKTLQQNPVGACALVCLAAIALCTVVVICQQSKRDKP